MRLKYELMACVDCLMFVANGDTPDTGDIESDIRGNLGTDDMRNLVCGDSEHDDEFSWSDCECCGSRLGGSRHQLAVIRSETPRERAQTERRRKEKRLASVK